MFDRLRFPAVSFFAASFVGLLQVYYAIRGGGWRLSLGAFAYGFLLGFGVQLCVREALPKVRVAATAFAGALTLWLPVVLLTYGFALLATAILVAYSAAVVMGVYIASLPRKGRCPQNAP